mgnify:CR=1 FL=1
MKFGQETFDFNSYINCSIDDQILDDFDFSPIPEFDFTPFLPPVGNTDTINYETQKIMTYEKFVKYIYSKIDPDDAILITKEMLIKLEKIFASEFDHKWNKLRRDDKRKKERVLQRLYENVNIIYDKLENEPDKYLIDVKKSILNKYNKK